MSHATVGHSTDPTTLTDQALRPRVLGCWLGKAVGGTLGMPFEGVDGPLDLTFYDPVPAEMLPNDDLDLQVLWACLLDRMNPPRVDRHVLADGWRHNIAFAMDEYGIARRNLELGLEPPLSGSYDNWFERGLGAAIRSEIWACLAPGNPRLAAAYAYEDACVDHAGEGIGAAVFLAALQSAAFVESNVDRLLDTALIELPVDSEIRTAVNFTRLAWRTSRDWRAVRNEILVHHGHENFTDVVQNLAFTVLGWLAGEGDFGRSICIATNCGKDTDCTAASLGALLGILDPDSIDARWLAPIGRELVLSPEITGITPPATLDDFTDLVLDLRRRLAGAWPEPRSIEQSVDHLALEAEIGHCDRRSFGFGTHDLGMLPPMQRVTFPGTLAEWPWEAVRGDGLVVRYPFHLERAGKVRIVFNTPENCRVWVDGRYAFGRECGRMCPASHRAPLHQTCVEQLEAGDHQLVAAIRRPALPRPLKWVVGLSDPDTCRWLPHALRRVNTAGA